jgi:DNA polymerase-3 subunit epsilon
MKSLLTLIRTDPGVPFVAIDFEVADYSRDSACAVALVRVEHQHIVERTIQLIRPPRREFLFSPIHGITWEDVADKPTFAECWPKLAAILTGARFLAAHYVPFDQSVLETCCDHAGLARPELPFLCTVWLARRTWNVRPTTLPNVCAQLHIPLTHEGPGSEAEACAQIVLATANSLKDRQSSAEPLVEP